MIYRIIVEKSPMSNNDEWIYYSKEPISKNECRNGKLVLCREVFKQEIEAGLKIQSAQSCFEYQPPDVTLLLDAFFKVSDHVGFWMKSGAFDGDPAAILAHQIYYDYYDCMSGGCGKFVLSVYRYLIQSVKIDDKTEIVPGYDGVAITFADFLKDTSHIVDFEHAVGDLLGQLPDMLSEGNG